jgi:hypothetical protein
MTPTREALLARINACECLSDTEQAIEDTESFSFDEDDSGLLDVYVSTRDTSSGVSFVLGLPRSVVLEGLRHMAEKLKEMA